MQKFLIFFWLLFAGLAATGQNILTGSNRVVRIKLSGKITDAVTGDPLPGVSVYLADDKTGTTTDTTGKYVLTNIPNGHHILEISHTGYNTIVEHIELTGNLEKNFSLSTVVIENQGVIVTGVTAATSIRQSPVPVTSLRRTALLQTSSSNIIDALRQVPGVSQLSTGQSVSKPVIRGLGYNRVVTVNDGVRQEGQQWGDEHGIEIDEMSVSRIEILKGPASLIYGSDALAGVIHFITNTPVAEGTVKGNFLANYQTNNSLAGINGSIAGNKNGFNWNAYVTRKSAGDYKNKYDGKVLNSRFNETNFGGYIGLNKSWGYSHLIFSRFNQELGMVEGDRDAATGKFILFAGTASERIASRNDLDQREPFVPKQGVRHTKLVWDNNFAIKKSRLKINLGYQRNQRKEFGDPEAPDREELFFDLPTFNYNIQWQLPEMNEWHTTIGVNGMRQSNHNKAEEVLIPEYDLFDIGGFVFAQRMYKKTTFTGGLRYDHRSVDSKGLTIGSEIKFTAFDRAFSNISGSVGLSHSPSEKITLKANVARGFRAPTLAEMASNGTHEGTNRYEYGTQQLNSETSLQLDAGLDLNYEHVSFGLSAFYNRINDFIFYRKLESVSGSDSLVDVGGEFIPAFQFNQHNATLTGFEISLDFHPHPLDWLHFENNFSFVHGFFDATIDGSKNLPLIPAARWSGELRADLKKTGNRFRNFYAKLETDVVFDQDKPFTGFGTETKTGGYGLVHAGLGSDIVNKGRPIFSLHLAVLNLTDNAYQNHLSRLKYAAENVVTGRRGVFNMGRNFSVKVNVPFSF